ncbi:MAG: hypothetical protein O7A62_05675, partial [Alphaproteobacteria bacterium]|nr:hypothetical protein [Alphaproteobacteria bacterium]
MTAADLGGEIRRALAHPASANMIGVERVRADGAGLYTPDADGPILAGIVAVMSPPGDIIIDLVAIDLARPDRFRRRTGLGDLLGEANLIGLNFTGEALLVHPG